MNRLRTQMLVAAVYSDCGCNDIGPRLSKQMSALSRGMEYPAKKEINTLNYPESKSNPSSLKNHKKQIFSCVDSVVNMLSD